MLLLIQILQEARGVGLIFTAFLFHILERLESGTQRAPFKQSESCRSA